MTSNEHQQLAQFLKDVHLLLRKRTSSLGVKAAWEDHCKDKDLLVKYAQSMEKLATTYWNKKSTEYGGTTSRIDWAASVISKYFDMLYLYHREKEILIGNKCNMALNSILSFSKPLKLLDVGSCYNPFEKYEFLDVLAIDLCPANVNVYQCDFLNVPLGTATVIKHNKIEQLCKKSFDAVTFCFLLEYLPNSDLRIQACTNAYNLLKLEGLLIIATPDSKHVGANCKIMKCWRYTLACLGFSRIKYEKFQHMHCMAFRKSLHIDVASRWAELHKEPYMDFSINIPQDYTSVENNEISPSTKSVNFSMQDLVDLPFYSET